MATQGIIASALQNQVKPVPLGDPKNQTTSTNAVTNGATTATTTTQPGVTGYNPVNVATPTAWTVDDKQTVAGQVKNLISEDSPIIQQARTNAKMAANDRGLTNSAMAVSAGESAAYSAALPIAQQDAETQAKAAGYSVDQINQANAQNAQYGNNAAQFNAGSANTRSNQDAQATTQKELQQMQSASQMDIQRLNSQTQIQLNQMDAQNRTALQDLQNQNQVLIQSNSQAANLMNQTTGVINNIMMNDKMNAEAKTEASRQVYEQLRTQLSILGKTSGLDLSTLLGENPYPDLAAEKAAQDAAFKESILSDPDYAAMLADYKQRNQAQSGWALFGGGS